MVREKALSWSKYRMHLKKLQSVFRRDHRMRITRCTKRNERIIWSRLGSRFCPNLNTEMTMKAKSKVRRRIRIRGMLLYSPEEHLLKYLEIKRWKKVLWRLRICAISWLAQKWAHFRSRIWFVLLSPTSAKQNMLQLLWRLRKISLWSTRLISSPTSQQIGTRQILSRWVMSLLRTFLLLVICCSSTATKFKCVFRRQH